jgi:hypothetical protein
MDHRIGRRTFRELDRAHDRAPVADVADLVSLPGASRLRTVAAGAAGVGRASDRDPREKEKGDEQPAAGSAARG